MSVQQHPIFIPNGFHIYTKPIEGLANFILHNVEEDHHGVPVYGGGGLGKTSAQEYLTQNVSLWLIDAQHKPIGVASRLIMPSGQRRSDSAFYTAMNNRLKLTNADRLSPQRGKDRIVNFVKTRCGQARQTLMVMFIDNAQRISRAEYEYLADVDEQITDARLRLFFVFVRQSDATGIDVTDDWSEYPSHMVRRWFMATHAFQPLISAADTLHALDRYDRYATWPTPDMSFTRYFAQGAFDNGWTLSQQAGLILDGVKALRSEYKLPESEAWPMATFTLTVRYLLANVAAQEKGFSELKSHHVKQALLASGYLRLEFVRAKLLAPDAAA